MHGRMAAVITILLIDSIPPNFSTTKVSAQYGKPSKFFTATAISLVDLLYPPTTVATFLKSSFERFCLSHSTFASLAEIAAFSKAFLLTAFSTANLVTVIPKETMNIAEVIATSCDQLLWMCSAKPFQKPFPCRALRYPAIPAPTPSVTAVKPNATP